MSRAAEGQADLRALEVFPGERLPESELPEVAVVIPTLDGRAKLAECLPALLASDYPAERVKTIVVDNGSADGTATWLARTHPTVEVVAQAENVGFARGTNLGVARAGAARVLVFLNNDVRVEATWLRELVGPIARGECASASGKMLSWDGKRIDHAGGGSNFHGIAIGHGYREHPGPQFDFARRSLFACGGAMAVDAAAYAAVGGLDDEYFAYYEDLDLGWRLWVAGHEVHYVPAAVCYHQHSSTSRSFLPEQIRLLQARNPLLTCFKNYGDDSLERVLPALMALAARRAWILGRLGEPDEFRIEGKRPGGSTGAVRRLLDKLRGTAGRHPIGRIGLADFMGLNDWLGNWSHWQRRRDGVQALRKRPDDEILPLFIKPFWCVEDDPAYVELQAALVRDHGIERLFEGLTYAGPEPYR